MLWFGQNSQCVQKVSFLQFIYVHKYLKFNNIEYINCYGIDFVNFETWSSL